MSYAPLFSVVHGKEFSDGDKECSKAIPVSPPFFSRQTSLDSVLFQDLDTFGLVLILTLDPILGRLAIVPSVDPPASPKDEIILEICEQIKGRHRPSSKEMLGHPSIRGNKVVCDRFVAEDMDEKVSGTAVGFCVGLEPCRDLAQEFLVVLHMLEHFDGEDSIKSPLVVKVKEIDIPGEYL